MRTLNLLFILFGLVIYLPANAQVAMNNASKFNFTSFKTNRVDVAPLNTSNPGNTSENEVNTKAAKDFKQRFGTNNASWQTTDNGFIAKFSANSIETTVAYEKHGKWIYAIRRYDEKNMPGNVRALVKSTYYDYTILHIDEVNVPEQENTIYIVLLQDDISLKTVRVSDGEMEILHDYKKG